MISLGFPPPHQWQYHYGKLVSIGQNTLFCIFAVVLRIGSGFFAQLRLFYILYYVF